MEDALVPSITTSTVVNIAVLILVLMEDALVPLAVRSFTRYLIVLILVLMEDALVRELTLPTHKKLKRS